MCLDNNKSYRTNKIAKTGRTYEKCTWSFITTLILQTQERVTASRADENQPFLPKVQQLVRASKGSKGAKKKKANEDIEEEEKEEIESFEFKKRKERGRGTVIVEREGRGRRERKEV